MSYGTFNSTMNVLPDDHPQYKDLPVDSRVIINDAIKRLSENYSQLYTGQLIWDPEIEQLYHVIRNSIGNLELVPVKSNNDSSTGNLGDIINI